MLLACCDQFHLLRDHQPAYCWHTASGTWKVQALTLPYSWCRQLSMQTWGGTAGLLVHWKQSATTWGKKAVILWVTFTDQDFFTIFVNSVKTSQGWDTTGEKNETYLSVYIRTRAKLPLSDSWSYQRTCCTFWVKPYAPPFSQLGNNALSVSCPILSIYRSPRSC